MDLVKWLRMIVYEMIKENGVIFDSDLLSELQKKYSVSKQQINDVLLHLEVMGLIKVSRVSKDKKRIEIRQVEKREGLTSSE